MAQVTKDGTITLPVVKALVKELKARGIKLLVVDPFVRSHRVNENDNMQIDYVASLWAQVAEEAGCCILLIHHFRKGTTGTTASIDSFRGAVALTDASRAARILTPMTADEASATGIEPTDRWRYIRIDDAKHNLAPPPEKAEWIKLCSVSIPTTDNMQVVVPWSPPSPWEGIDWAIINRIFKRFEEGPEEGEFWSPVKQAKERWAGHAIIQETFRTPEQAQVLLKAWRENGALLEDHYASPKRNGAQAACLKVNPDVFSEIRRKYEAPNNPFE